MGLVTSDVCMRKSHGWQVSSGISGPISITSTASPNDCILRWRPMVLRLVYFMSV